MSIRGVHKSSEQWDLPAYVGSLDECSSRFPFAEHPSAVVPQPLDQSLVPPFEVVQDEGRLHSSHRLVPLPSLAALGASSSRVPVASSIAMDHLVVVAVEAVRADMSMTLVVELAVP